MITNPVQAKLAAHLVACQLRNREIPKEAK